MRKRTRTTGLGTPNAPPDEPPLSEAEKHEIVTLARRVREAASSCHEASLHAVRIGRPDVAREMLRRLRAATRALAGSVDRWERVALLEEAIGDAAKAIRRGEPQDVAILGARSLVSHCDPELGHALARHVGLLVEAVRAELGDPTRRQRKTERVPLAAEVLFNLACALDAPGLVGNAADAESWLRARRKHALRDMHTPEA